MIVAYHAIMVEIHDDGRMQVRVEDARLVDKNGRKDKVVDNAMSSPIGTPLEAADQLLRAAAGLSELLARTPVLAWTSTAPAATSIPVVREKSDDEAHGEGQAILSESLADLEPRAEAYFEDLRARAEAAGHSPRQQALLLYGVTKVLVSALLQRQELLRGKLRRAVARKAEA